MHICRPFTTRKLEHKLSFHKYYSCPHGSQCQAGMERSPWADFQPWMGAFGKTLSIDSLCSLTASSRQNPFLLQVHLSTWHNVWTQHSILCMVIIQPPIRPKGWTFLHSHSHELCHHHHEFLILRISDPLLFPCSLQNVVGHPECNAKLPLLSTIHCRSTNISFISIPTQNSSQNLKKITPKSKKTSYLMKSCHLFSFGGMWRHAASGKTCGRSCSIARRYCGRGSFGWVQTRLEICGAIEYALGVDSLGSGSMSSPEAAGSTFLISQRHKTTTNEPMQPRMTRSLQKDPKPAQLLWWTDI